LQPGRPESDRLLEDTLIVSPGARYCACAVTPTTLHHTATLTERPRSRREALGPLPGISEKWPRMARRRARAMPKFHSRTSDPRPNQRLRDHRLLAGLFEKGV